MVDTTRVQKPPYQRGRFRANQRNLRGRGGRSGVQGGGMQSLGKGVKARDTYKRSQVKKWGQGRVRKVVLGICQVLKVIFQPQIKIRDASVTVRPDWVTIEEMDFPRLGKLSLPSIKDGMLNQGVIITNIKYECTKYCYQKVMLATQFMEFCVLKNSWLRLMRTFEHTD